MSSVGGSPTKTQFYSANGAGRDSYIWGNNGGFCPSKEPCKIEELGKSHSNADSKQSLNLFSNFAQNLCLSIE